MSFPINLLGDLLAVKVESVEGAIRLPDWKKSLSGTVLQVGPDCKSIENGLRVSFGAAVGMDSILNGQSIRILKEQDIDLVYFEDCGIKGCTLEKSHKGFCSNEA